MEKVGMRTILIGREFGFPKCAILNSRQSKTPVSRDKWVENTVRAVDFARSSNLVVLSSTGINTYELILGYASETGAIQTIVLPLFKNQDPQQIADSIIRDFRCNPDKISFLFFETDLDKKFHKRVWQTRDKFIRDLADILFPVSIREGGFMDKICSDKRNTDLRFKTEYCKGVWQPPRPLSAENINPALKSLKWNYLTHLTRTFYNAYPDETPAGYYISIVNCRNGYSHSAFNTLIHILEKGTISAASTEIRGKFDIISFTSKHPSEFPEIIRWRNRKVNYTYEPYGIAIEHDIIEETGARKVIYGDDTVYENLSDNDKPFFQFHGRDLRWTDEDEWRINGDLDLKPIPPEKIIIIVRDKNEANIIRERFPKLRVISIT
jgi:hypothetical protein